MTRLATCGCVSLVAVAGILSAALALGDPAVRLSEVVRVAGSDLGMLEGHRLDQLTLVSCVRTACRAIPFQIDERDATGNWVLDQGPEPNAGQASGGLDHNDLLLFMATDAGDQARRADLPGWPAVEITVQDPLSGTPRWAYLVAFPHAAPRSEVSYVRYDPANDRVRGRRVSLGFNNGVPDYLAVAGPSGDTPDGPNLLDRLKVRATATFLWGLIRFSRDESDLRTEFIAWRARADPGHPAPAAMGSNRVGHPLADLRVVHLFLSRLRRATGESPVEFSTTLFLRRNRRARCP